MPPSPGRRCRRFRAIFGALAGLLLVGPAAAQPLRVIDGDTVALGAERIRLLGIDAPEMRARCPAERRAAEAAAEALRALLAQRFLEVRREGRDRYGRTLARILAGGRDVSDALLAAGHAAPYDGGRRRPPPCGD